MTMPDLSLEQAAWDQGATIVCGIDEAGRGPWAGPVVAAAVILGPLTQDDVLMAHLNDSKKLSAARREALFRILEQGADIGVGIAEAPEIDALNILEATYVAMRRAIDNLAARPDYALIDGNRMPPLACAGETVVKGDSRSVSIAAASIIAKVTRDRIMTDLAAVCPGYGWERNAGYGTAEHAAALSNLGVTEQHRRSFKPVRERLAVDA